MLQVCTFNCAERRHAGPSFQQFLELLSVSVTRVGASKLRCALPQRRAFDFDARLARGGGSESRGTWEAAQGAERGILFGADLP